MNSYAVRKTDLSRQTFKVSNSLRGHQKTSRLQEVQTDVSNGGHLYETITYQMQQRNPDLKLALIRPNSALPQISS